MQTIALWPQYLGHQSHTLGKAGLLHPCNDFQASPQEASRFNLFTHSSHKSLSATHRRPGISPAFQPLRQRQSKLFENSLTAIALESFLQSVASGNRKH
jgi:hypothetical protein